MAAASVDPLLPIDGPADNCIPAELLANPLFLLVRMGLAIKGRAVEEFERTGFGPYHHSILALLDEGSRETQASIADALQLDRGTLVGLLDGLEEHGLIERQRDKNDRRRYLVSLTTAGRRQLKAFREIVDGLDAEFLAPLSADDRAELLALLSRMAGHYSPAFVRETTLAPLPGA